MKTWYAVCGFALFLAGWSNQAFAQGSTCGGVVKKVVIVYENGIGDSFLYAKTELRALEAKIKAVVPPEEFATYDFRLEYNDTHGYIADFIESVFEKAANDTYLHTLSEWLDGSAAF